MSAARRLLKAGGARYGVPVHPLWASIVPVTNGLITGSMKTPRKAVALLSGGLDSMLAARLILEQGIQVKGINFSRVSVSRATRTQFVTITNKPQA